MTTTDTAPTRTHMLRFTVQEFATRTNIARPDCYSFLRFLKVAGLAEIIGNIKPANGKGKGADVYALKDNFLDELAALCNKAAESSPK